MDMCSFNWCTYCITQRKVSMHELTCLCGRSCYSGSVSNVDPNQAPLVHTKLLRPVVCKFLK